LISSPFIQITFSLFLSNIWVFSMLQLPIQFITPIGLLLTSSYLQQPFSVLQDLFYTAPSGSLLTHSCLRFPVSVNIFSHEVYSSTLKVEEAGSFEMLVNIVLHGVTSQRIVIFIVTII
jgi:hypothetical protein